MVSGNNNIANGLGPRMPMSFPGGPSPNGGSGVPFNANPAMAMRNQLNPWGGGDTFTSNNSLASLGEKAVQGFNSDRDNT